MEQQPKDDHDLINNRQTPEHWCQYSPWAIWGGSRLSSGNISRSVDLYGGHNNMDFPHSDITLTTLLPLGLCQRHCLQAEYKLNMGATVDHC
jgi:hypothetical protein